LPAQCWICCVERFIHLPVTFDFVALKVDRGRRNRGVAQVVAHRREFRVAGERGRGVGMLCPVRRRASELFGEHGMIGSYPQQNGLAVALREIGRIERTLFILDWLQNVELRRRVHVGLNKGEARNALARSVFFYRLGEVRDRSFEARRRRASGLNLVTAAIVFWNTVYLERTIQVMAARGVMPETMLLPYLSPLGWEHINLTGDYVWKHNQKLQPGKYRPLRPLLGVPES